MLLQIVIIITAKLLLYAQSKYDCNHINKKLFYIHLQCEKNSTHYSIIYHGKARISVVGLYGKL